MLGHEEILGTTLARTADRFYGKYRGIVTVNVDPLKMGRLQALVPEVLGEIPSTWAMPCTPYAGVISATFAGFFAIPPPGSGVWIEFEAGNPDHPIWSGCYWGASQVPMDEAMQQGLFTSKVLRSDTGLMVSLNDLTQTVTISDTLGTNIMSIKVLQGTIEIRALGRVVLEAPLIQHGQIAVHPAVQGDILFTYLNTLMALFNTHVHPGELAVGILPVTPAPPVAPFPPVPPMLSTKVLVE